MIEIKASRRDRIITVEAGPEVAAAIQQAGIGVKIDVTYVSPVDGLWHEINGGFRPIGQGASHVRTIIGDISRRRVQAGETPVKFSDEDYVALATAIAATTGG